MATTAAASPLLGDVAPIGVAGMASSAHADDTAGLLRRHFPRYYFDRAEGNFFPCDVNKYMVDQSCIAGCNGAAVKREDGMTWLIYINYYVEDGGLQICGCACTCCTTGDHPYDLEVVVVEVDPNATVSGVFYAPHSSHEHFWIRDHEDIDEIMGGEGGDGYRPEVYISRGKHASYPVGGKIARLFGFGNDRCTDPVASDIPFVPLTQAAIELDLIDNVYPGPSTKVTRDWSVAPDARVADVKRRRFFPAWSQIQSELGGFFSRCSCS